MKNLIALLNTLLKNETFLKYQPVIIPSVIVVVCVILFFTFTLPQIFKIQANQKQLSELKQKNDFYSEKLLALGKIEPQSYRDNLSASLVALPDDRDIPGVIGLITQTVNASGMVLEAIAFAAPTAPTPNINNYQIRIQVTGGMPELKIFNEKIKQVPRVMKLSYVELSTSIGGKTDASLELTAYFQPLPSNIGSVDDPLSQLTQQDLQNLDRLKNYITPVSIETSNQPAGPVGKSDPFN